MIFYRHSFPHFHLNKTQGGGFNFVQFNLKITIRTNKNLLDINLLTHFLNYTLYTFTVYESI